MHPSRHLLLAIILTLLAGCAPGHKQIQLNAPWNYSDLREVSSSQIEKTPSRDLQAIYTRQNGLEWQFRLDFLDLSSPPDCDIYVAIDTKTGGTSFLPLDVKTNLKWDTLLIIPASGQIEALSPDPSDASRLISRSGMRILVIRDPVIDAVEISINRAALDAPLGFRVQVFVTPAGSKSPDDSLGPVRSDGTPPARANVLLAFWNSLPAYTPAQALRRWDGAHTGPLGGRHGLSNLLHAARSTKTALTLLDLKLPASLAALDSVQETKFVDKLSAQGLLILPDNLPGFAANELPAPLPDWSLERFQSESRQIGLKFGLPASQFSFAPFGLDQAVQSVDSTSKVLFIPATQGIPSLEPVTMLRWGNLKVIPIPGYGLQDSTTQQASLDGPTLAMRQALVRAANSEKGNAARVLILGGDLSTSVWGNPNAAVATMKYLAAHPWVHVLNANDLLAANPDGSVGDIYQPLPPLAPNAIDSVAENLSQAPDNSIANQAWQMYESLFAPTYPVPAALPGLRANYLGQVNTLLKAAGWAACQSVDQHSSTFCPEPGKTLVDCTVDPDLDNQPECLLASENFLGVFEITGGYLSFAFARDSKGDAHQLIAPSSELMAGLSESTTWDLSAGAGADPEVMPGAFIDLTPFGNVDLLTMYKVDPLPNGIKFTAPDGKLSKTFILSSNELVATFQSNTQMRTQIPLVLDPWIRFNPGWMNDYESGQDGQSWYWAVQQRLEGQSRSSAPVIQAFKIEIRSSVPYSIQTFQDTQDILASPENPNRDNPPGHFLPFPMATVEINSAQNFSVQIDFSSIEQ